jgi:hypothetical protein
VFSLERVLGGLERVLGGTICLSINKRFRDRHLKADIVFHSVRATFFLSECNEGTKVRGADCHLCLCAGARGTPAAGRAARCVPGDASAGAPRRGAPPRAR